MKLHVETRMTKNWLLGAKQLIAVSVGLVLWVSTSQADDDSSPRRILASGAGQGTAAQFITYVGLDGELRNVGSIGTIGNPFSFGFTATRDKHGNIEGQMEFTDNVLGMSINSDVEVLEVHTTHASPHGDKGLSFKMTSSTESVVINGEEKPNWKFVNSPTFDGGPHAADTVCFEIFNAEGVKILQWSAFVSAGNVEFKTK